VKKKIGNKMNKLIEAMKVAFATHFQYYVKSHGFHLNLVGSDFSEFHQLFETIYDEAQDNIDSFAEHIRALDSLVPMAIPRIAELGKIKDQLSTQDAMKMTKELLADTELLNTLLADVYDLAGAERCYGLQNYIADRIDFNAKMIWQLRSTTK
jgi:starvation-inducible DNA-binding protein